ncbi:MAG: insulinase family protein [Planctomycetota bacterium]
MTVLLVERHDTPTIATYLQFNVGGVDDPKGQTGIAHLLERMMFKGTESFGTASYEAEKPPDGEARPALGGSRSRALARPLAPFHQVDEQKVKQIEKEIADVTAEQKKFIIKNELWQAYQRPAAPA